jgi:hypothetical protein
VITLNPARVVARREWQGGCISAEVVKQKHGDRLFSLDGCCCWNLFRRYRWRLRLAISKFIHGEVNDSEH